MTGREPGSWLARCEVHGPLRRQADGLWKCRGWDGEHDGNWCTAFITDEAMARVGSGATRWPGVAVERLLAGGYG